RKIIKLIMSINNLFLLISNFNDYINKNTYLIQQKKPSFEQSFSIIPDNRPSDYEYAVLSNHTYEKNIKPGDIIKIGKEEWHVISTKSGGNDYYGVMYQNHRRKQIVLAH